VTAFRKSYIGELTQGDVLFDHPSPIVDVTIEDAHINGRTVRMAFVTHADGAEWSSNVLHTYRVVDQ
jgi:hypothetical protein